jgi:HD-GYP domain-containing protein (c-di-GMP phosphodiesterase class II)
MKTVQSSEDIYAMLERLKALNTIGVALSSEKNSTHLLEMILNAAKTLTNADGGTLYTATDKFLHFEIMITDSLGLHLGGSSGKTIGLPPLPLHDDKGEPNLHMVAVCAVLTGKTINIPDAYRDTRFEFSGTKAFDTQTGYHSQSFLTVPLKDRNNKAIGVLQLINAKESISGKIQAFTWLEQQLVESLASQAAVALTNQRLIERQQHFVDSLKKLNEIGVALSAEKDANKLLQIILEAAKDFTHADGGTLYLKENNQLKFEIMLTESLNIHQGGNSGVPVTQAPLPLYNENGEENRHIVAAYAALSKRTINIPDAYINQEFEFSGMKRFDQMMGYRSKSFLTVPLIDHEGEVSGVLQLINATEPQTREPRPFTEEEQQLAESLASQAAVALVNQRLLSEQKNLFDAFIQLIANAIDDKSPYTGGHCKRVPELTMMIADAVARCHDSSEEIQRFEMNEEQRYELYVASMLHDCGKITTKEYVVDKSTKLETIYDRIHLVDMRFEMIKRDAEIAFLRQQLAEAGMSTSLPPHLSALYQNLDEERAFIHRCNVGGEFLSDEAVARIEEIAKQRWRNLDSEQAPLLDEEEVYNLSIRKGTLTTEERDHINHHISATIHMLEALPFPKYLKKVPEYAGGHHERMDGKGYPRGLKRDQMSLPARMMGIADIFEALTASDRPYKKAMPLSTALTILGKMKLDNHIDPDLFDVFIRERIYLEYAQKYLPASQIDEIDISKIPGYSGDDSPSPLKTAHT